MTAEEIIEQLERLIDDREAFIRAYAPDRNVFVRDKEALEEAVKVLKRYNRLVQVKTKPVKQRIKIQYEGEELTIKELVGKLEYLKESQEYLKWVVVEREKEIALLKKQLADVQPAIISSSNIPLTPEELLEMVGQPVWTVGVSFTDDGKWEMWDIVEDIDKDGITFGYSTESREWWNYNLRDEQGNLLGCAWTCYRQPPKEVRNVQRLIDADALHSEISKWPDSVMYKDWVQSAIATAPTVPSDVQPVRHGRWILEDDFEIVEQRLKCSKCGWWTINLFVDGSYNYCPRCGAKMDGGKL